MSRRGNSTFSRSRQGRLPDAIGEYPLGRHSGLPLIVCDVCFQHRVIELVVQTDENGNRGRVFFKCPRNNPGVPGRCTFYEFQREYLYKLVMAKKVVLLPGEGADLNDEAVSALQVPEAFPGDVLKIDALVRLLTILCVLMCVGMLSSVANLFM